MKSTFWLLPESSFQDVLGMLTLAHTGLVVDVSAEWGLLWSSGNCLVVRTVTASGKGKGWTWGWLNPLSCGSAPVSDLFQVSHGDRLCSLHHWALAPTADCIQKLLLYRLLTRMESWVVFMCSRLEDKEPAELIYSIRLTAGWTWTVPQSEPQCSIKWRLELCAL